MVETAELQIDWEPTASDILLSVDGWRLVRSPAVDRYALSIGTDVFADTEKEIRAQHERVEQGTEFFHRFLTAGLDTAAHGELTDPEMRTLVSPEGRQWRCYSREPGMSTCGPAWMDDTRFDPDGGKDETIPARELLEKVPSELRGFVVVQTRAALLEALPSLPGRRETAKMAKASWWDGGWSIIEDMGKAVSLLRDEHALREWEARKTGAELHYCGEYPSIEPGEKEPDAWKTWRSSQWVPFPCGGTLTWFESVVSMAEADRGGWHRVPLNGWSCSWCERITHGPAPRAVAADPYQFGSCMPIERTS